MKDLIIAIKKPSYQPKSLLARVAVEVQQTHLSGGSVTSHKRTSSQGYQENIHEMWVYR